MKNAIEGGAVSFNHIVELYDRFCSVKSIAEPISKFLKESVCRFSAPVGFGACAYKEQRWPDIVRRELMADDDTVKEVP